MDTTNIQRAIETAKTAVKLAAEFKNETYFAVLLATLLQPPEESRAIVLVKRNEQSGTQTSPSKHYSAPEFFAVRNWTTENDKVVLAGCFLERHSGVSNFGIQEIRNCLINAKVAIPKNVSLAVLKSVQRGWIMEVPGGRGGAKAWVLTQTGERHAAELAK